MRTLIVAFAAGLAVLLAAPADADPPDRFEAVFAIPFPDVDNNLVGLLNTDRESFCTPEMIAFEEAVIAWFDGGQVGPFPPEPPWAAFDPIQIQRPDLRTGALLSYGRADNLHLELWYLDDVEDRGFVGACLDTDDRLERFAVGTADWSFHATDLNFTGTRAIVFNPSIRAEVVDSDGQRYLYRWDPHDNLTCLENTFNSDACFVLNAQLQPIGR